MDMPQHWNMPRAGAELAGWCSEVIAHHAGLQLWHIRDAWIVPRRPNYKGTWVRIAFQVSHEGEAHQLASTINSHVWGPWARVTINPVGTAKAAAGAAPAPRGNAVATAALEMEDDRTFGMRLVSMGPTADQLAPRLVARLRSTEAKLEAAMEKGDTQMVVRLNKEKADVVAELAKPRRDPGALVPHCPAPEVDGT